MLLACSLATQKRQPASRYTTSYFPGRPHEETSLSMYMFARLPVRDDALILPVPDASLLYTALETFTEPDSWLQYVPQQWDRMGPDSHFKHQKGNKSLSIPAKLSFTHFSS